MLGGMMGGMDERMKVGKDEWMDEGMKEGREG